MKLFSRLFGVVSESAEQPDIRFGRYSDGYKNDANYDAWDEALTSFDASDFMGAYRAFFRYLRDETEDNVRWWDGSDGSIRFELYQGSKKITGFASQTQFKAEAKIARPEVLNVGFMRRLMEYNYNLKFSRFALDESDCITILFDTHTLDSSPYKLYYALKELATNADKQDDLLMEEFRSLLHSLESDHLLLLPDAERRVKYEFVCANVQSLLGYVAHGTLDAGQYPGGISYLLLDKVYRLDYLVSPQGYMMEALERMHRVYFEKDDKTPAQKNKELTREFSMLVARSEEEFGREFYRVPATFGITVPVNHDRIVGFIEAELSHADWYLAHGYEEVALAIPGYIVGFCLFNYSLPLPDRELFELYFQIVEADYFQGLGFELDYYNPATKKFNPKAIRRAIDCVVAENKEQYPDLKPALRLLNFDSLPVFAYSFLRMIQGLDATKAS